MLISSAIEVKVELFVAGIGLVTERREVNMTEDIADLSLALGILAAKSLEHKIREKVGAPSA